LEKSIKKGRFEVRGEVYMTKKAFEKANSEQIKKGLEGAVVKKWNSVYEPGRKGFHWVKFKEEEGKTGKLTDTIDAVVMGYYHGEGKRAGLGIGAFLVGVYDEKEDRFLTIAKIGTGLKDEEWRELKVKGDGPAFVEALRQISTGGLSVSADNEVSFGDSVYPYGGVILDETGSGK